MFLVSEYSGEEIAIKGKSMGYRRGNPNIVNDGISFRVNGPSNAETAIQIITFSQKYCATSHWPVNRDVMVTADGRVYRFLSRVSHRMNSFSGQPKMSPPGFNAGIAHVVPPASSLSATNPPATLVLSSTQHGPSFTLSATNPLATSAPSCMRTRRMRAHVLRIYNNKV
ncbi:hypothetical protein BDP27DRAFT_1428394 [Rhodocollybia butyracea]|uniref:Uncharacterized protein n=1 Tax=Rhodocollybia butyracea TaxID=206335 RepID=A0A9P5PF14_9AGAR|nr:hypothetical protein BDP27DRAFT_1428394 [Rhodocollybia butyracea]